MATGSWPTLADVASRVDASGDMHIIAEMLSQAIALTKDLYMVESSEMFGHEFGLGTLEDYSQVDRLLAEGSGNIERFRESEDVAFLEGMGQTIEQTAWYGN